MINIKLECPHCGTDCYVNPAGIVTCPVCKTTGGLFKKMEVSNDG